MRPSGRGATLVAVAALVLVYFLAGKLGLSLALVHPSASAVWPPTGIAFAALLVLGWRYWPAILLGAFLVNVTTAESVPVSAGIAMGNTLEALVGTLLVNRFAGGRAAFDSAAGFFLFVILGAITSTTISAAIGATSLVFGGSATWADFNAIWLTWWLGDAVGAIVVAPLLVLLLDQPRWSWSRLRVLETVLLVLGLASLGFVSFGASPWGAQNLPLSFLPVPALLWAGFRFGRRGAATASLLMGVIAIWGTLQGCGPFARLPRHESLVLLQVFLGLVSVMVFTVAVIVRENRAVTSALRHSQQDLETRVQQRTLKLSLAIERLQAEIRERQQAQSQLAESEAQFRGLLESGADAICIVGQDGRIRMVNSQTEKFFGFRREELLGKTIEILVPEGLRSRHVAHRASLFANPHVRTMGEGQELFGRRKDGSEFPVDISLTPIQSGEGLLVSAAIRDITRRKRLEAERRAAEVIRGQLEELSRSTRDIATLGRMGDMLRAAISVAETYPLVPQFLEELFPADSGVLYAFHNSRKFLETVATWGPAAPSEEFIEPDQCWALRRGQSHTVRDGQAAAACPHLAQSRPDMSVCIPMMAQGETLGLFHLRTTAASGDEARAATLAAHKQRLAQASAEQIAAGIAHAKLHETLRAQASRDPLTGLSNRRSMEEALERELHRAARRNSRLGVLMIDVDRFKEFNDRFGHAAGDVALREIGRFLVSSARREDIVSRFGGEEMTIVLSDCPLKDLVQRAQRIREGVKNLRLEHEGRAFDAVSVSVGVAVFPDHGRSADELLRAADQALYQAKGQGRDLVVVASSMRLEVESE